MRKEKILAFMLFAALVAEDQSMYDGNMWTPARLLGWFVARLPIKVTIFQIACLYFLATVRRKGKDRLAKPVVRAVYLGFLTLLACILFGMARGGEWKPIYTQTYMWSFGLMFALTVMRVMNTVEDYHLLTSAIAWAALWRSCTAISYYVTLRGSTNMPALMTTHEDSVLFVAGIAIFVSRALEFRTRKAIRAACLALPLMLLAIQVNNRRLAWAGLAGSIMILYVMLPSKTKFTRRLNRALLTAAPVVALYVAIGWGRSETIFKPLAAFASMGSAKAGGQLDRSTKARENENLSMVLMIQQRPLFGTGFGHEFVEVDSTFSVPRTIYPMYGYSPHNSVLAILAFTGAFGFLGIWLAFPVSVYFNSRTYRASQNPIERSVAVIGIVEVLLYLNQAYGDMGLTYMTPALIVGAGIAAAGRLSMTSGAGAPRQLAAGPTPTA